MLVSCKIWIMVQSKFYHHVKVIEIVDVSWGPKVHLTWNAPTVILNKFVKCMLREDE